MIRFNLFRSGQMGLLLDLDEVPDRSRWFWDEEVGAFFDTALDEAR